MPTSGSASSAKRVLLTGGSGYLGRALIPHLLDRGHSVRALIREETLEADQQEGGKKLPQGVDYVEGNALEASDVADALRGCDTLIHLVGVPKPAPTKAAQFHSIDLTSIQASVTAASEAKPQPHLVYLSVAQPAPVMKAYIKIRAEGELLIQRRILRSTLLRPWYVLGPGRRWPYLLMPCYSLLRAFPLTRDTAQRLGFVTLSQMTGALLNAVENPPEKGTRILSVPDIRACRPAFSL